jgi:hypothetical protein
MLSRTGATDFIPAVRAWLWLEQRFDRSCESFWLVHGFPLSFVANGNNLPVSNGRVVPRSDIAESEHTNARLW